ncbi:MAG: phosphatase PAP2 family protein [Chloroflexi bacterium]|nr:phosphatase PAP2 family protein [Chloroflexota bacterium]
MSRGVWRSGQGGIALSALVVALAFGALAVGAIVWPVHPGDVALARAVQAAIPPDLLPLLRAIALLGEGVVFAPLALGMAALLWMTGQRRPGLLVLSALIPGALNPLVKLLIGRPRPDPDLLLVLPDPASGLGFPSGHAVITVALYGALTLALVSWWPLPRAAHWVVRGAYPVLVLLMGLERVAVGAHWPSDVLGGYLLGLLYLHGVLLAHRTWGRTSPTPLPSAGPHLTTGTPVP